MRASGGSALCSLSGKVAPWAPPDRRAKAYALNLTRNGEAGTGHVAASQIRMRLLPLSATATVEPRADSP